MKPISAYCTNNSTDPPTHRTNIKKRHILRTIHDKMAKVLQCDNILTAWVKFLIWIKIHGRSEFRVRTPPSSKRQGANQYRCISNGDFNEVVLHRRLCSLRQSAQALLPYAFSQVERTATLSAFDGNHSHVRRRSLPINEHLQVLQPTPSVPAIDFSTSLSPRSPRSRQLCGGHWWVSLQHL